MAELPFKKKNSVKKNPGFLIMFSKPKAGKTTALSLLEKNLIIDTENGTDYITGHIVKANCTKEIGDVVAKLKAAKEEGLMYDYITIDTATALEDMVGDLAIKLYRETPMGKTFGANPGEDNVKKLPNGAGYLYLREAFEKVIKMLRPYAKECLILTGHVADKMINKHGEEVSEMQLDLSGKLGKIMYSRADAVGFLYRDKNQCKLNFDGGGDVIIEARSQHLRGKKIVLTEMKDDGTIIGNWNKIFIK